MRTQEEIQIKSRYDAIKRSWISHKNQKNLTSEDLERRIAKEVVDFDLKYYEVTSFSVPKPESIRKYEMMSKEEKYKYDKDFPEWRERFGASAWLKERDSHKQQQESNQIWLKTWLGLLKDDEARYIKLQDFILKNRIPEETIEYSQKLVNTFGGRVVRQWED